MSTPIHKTQNMRARLAFFDSLQLSQTPAGKPGRSPVCVDLSPHIEGLQAKISAAEPDVRDVRLTIAHCVMMALILTLARSSC